MTLSEAISLGIPAGMYPGFAHMSVEEVCTQRCDDCNKVLAVHPDARWRFHLNVIRCVPCQRVAQRAGYNEAEAMYVS